MDQATMSILLAGAVAASLYATTKFLANRRYVKRLQDAKLPMPEYHPVFGHLLALKACIEALPRNVTFHLVIQKMAEQFSNGVFYLNLWPFNPTVIVVAKPSVASQVQAASLDKPAAICATMEIINGGPSLMTMKGSEWKEWRGLFSPGFSAGYMTGLAPAIADEVVVFCDILRKLASKGDVFQLEEYTLRLTFDVIGRVTFGGSLRYQTQGSPMADCLRRQILWTPFATTFNPLKRYLSPRPLVQRYNSYRMNQYLDQEIDKRFEELVESRESPPKRTQQRSVISLVMDGYLDKVQTVDETSRRAFRELAKPQLRMFLFAGHDTTSSTLLYCYLLLSRHPEILSKVRTEHDNVFGTGFSVKDSSHAIANDPTLLNQIPYTMAVIKEVLRIFPPAGSVRQGRRDLVLRDEDGRDFPTENCYVWTLSLAMQNSNETFVNATEFKPERWLVGPDDPLHPQKGAWRPFEWGPRNCIGQTLAQLELKVALVMTIRLFDITPAYDEWDRLYPPTSSKVVNGNRAYQAELGGGGAHPADGLPVRVSLRG